MIVLLSSSWNTSFSSYVLFDCGELTLQFRFGLLRWVCAVVVVYLCISWQTTLVFVPEVYDICFILKVSLHVIDHSSKCVFVYLFYFPVSSLIVVLVVFVHSSFSDFLSILFVSIIFLIRQNGEHSCASNFTFFCQMQNSVLHYFVFSLWRQALWIMSNFLTWK